MMKSRFFFAEPSLLLVLLAWLLLTDLLRAEPYAAWINVGVNVARTETPGRAGKKTEARDPTTVPETTIKGKLTLASVPDRGSTSPSALNTLVCREIARRALKQSRHRLLIPGTRIIENNYEGPILELVRGIWESFRTDLLLEAEAVETFVALQLEDPREAGLLPVKMLFDVTAVQVREDRVSEEHTIFCPATPPLFGRGSHFRRSSILYLALIVLAVALGLIYLGIKVLS